MSWRLGTMADQAELHGGFDEFLRGARSAPAPLHQLCGSPVPTRR